MHLSAADLRLNASPAPHLEKWHYRTAVPFPPGVLLAGAHLELRDHNGRLLPCQFTPLATWGPRANQPVPEDLKARPGIRWIGLDFTAATRARRTHFTLRYGNLGQGRKETAPSINMLKVAETDAAVTVDNGLLRFTVRKRQFNFIDSLEVEGKRIIAPGSGSGVYATKADGTACWSAHDPAPRVILEEAGPMLAVVRAEGWHHAPGARAGDRGFCKYVVRIYAYADVPYIKVQHTWINTEDSDQAGYGAFGLFVPGTGKLEGVSDGVDLPKGRSRSLLVKDWQTLETLEIENATGSAQRIAVGGEAAGGWLIRGAIGFGIRDLVQNYPKEIEFAAEGTWLHLWPRHAAGAQRAPAADHLWRLWFCHEGRQLSFRLPESYRAPEFQDLVAPEGNGYFANAMGIAKTHEMILVFGEAARQTATYHAVFSEDPSVSAAGKWNCDSLALGAIHEEDFAAFPKIERSFLDGHESYVRWRDRNHDWGMWSFGDTHSTYGVHAPTYYRIMQATHYYPPTAAWLLHFRSGRQTYLTQARRNSLHIMDTDICHYVSPEYRPRDQWFDKKAVGGLCDYKGFVHWHAGARGGYNSVVDFLWWDYYVNGNGRARDVALEHGDYVLRKGYVTDERGGDAVLNTTLDMYLATWDLKYWQKVRKYAPLKKGTMNWAAYYRTYLSLIDDPIVQDRVLTWADEQPRWLDVQAEACRLTGHPKYLTTMQNALKRFEYEYYDAPREDEWYRKQGGAGGCDGQIGYRLHWLFQVRRFPYAMAALLDAPTRPAFNVEEWRDGGAAHTGAGSHLLMVVDNPEGRPLEIPGWFSGYKGPIWHSIIGPDGEVVAFRQDGAPHPLPVPAPDGKRGLYAVYFGAAGKGVQLHYGAPKSPKRLCFVLEEGGALDPIGPVHIFVPHGTKRFVITYRSNWNSGLRATINLVDPSGTTRHRADLPPRITSRAEIAPAPEETGKTWLLVGRGYRLLKLEGLPQFLAPAPDRIVEPNRFERYIRRLSYTTLPNIRQKEKEHAQKVLAQDKATFHDPQMNGLMEIVHHELRRKDRRYGSLPRWYATVTTAQRPGQYLEWRTRPVPTAALKQQTYTLYWIGDMALKPGRRRPNFVLRINGEDAVAFNVGGEEREWRGRNGAKLTFEPCSSRRGGHQGTFRLSVPATMLKANEPLTLRVYAPKGDTGHVWFGIFEACIRKPG